jgi:hypothetical protein
LVKLWGVLRKRQRIARDTTATARSGELQDVKEAVDEICRAFDIARPMWLAKHEGDMEKFGRCVVLPDDFVEALAYDRFEVEILKDKGKSKDPRNDFSV